ncbi:MAG: heavy-metal-associated domain-containing protein [Bacteroidales bacterium]|nr:heavy-metal-associated domain-containing protein [Bacteroidales bacterium]
MKKQLLINLLIIAVVAVMTACGGSVKNDLKGADPDAGKVAMEKNLQSVELAVGGMTCTGCEVAIVGAVSKIKGVKLVDAFHLEGLAAITFDTTVTDLDQIRVAIEESGYTTGDVEVIEPNN